MAVSKRRPLRIAWLRFELLERLTLIIVPAYAMVGLGMVVWGVLGHQQIPASAIDIMGTLGGYLITSLIMAVTGASAVDSIWGYGGMGDIGGMGTDPMGDGAMPNTPVAPPPPE